MTHAGRFGSLPILRAGALIEISSDRGRPADLEILAEGDSDEMRRNPLPELRDRRIRTLCRPHTRSAFGFAPAGAGPGGDVAGSVLEPGGDLVATMPAGQRRIRCCPWPRGPGDTPRPPFFTPICRRPPVDLPANKR
jgi:hypothetical protein